MCRVGCSPYGRSMFLETDSVGHGGRSRPSSVSTIAKVRSRRRVRRRPVFFDDRHEGDAGYAQGGYASGVVAAAFGTPIVEVRSLRPVPLGRQTELAPMPGGRFELRSGEGTHAVGVRADLAIDLPTGPSAAAGVWTPHAGEVDARGRVLTEFVWAALDCPQLSALRQEGLINSNESVVSAIRTTRIDRPVVAGESYMVMGWLIAREGRMIVAGGAVIAPDGAPCVIGLHTAIAASRETARLSRLSGP